MRIVTLASSAQLRHKLAALGTGSVIGTAAVLATVGAWQTGQFTADASVRVEELVEADLQHVVEGIERVTTSVGSSVRDRQDDNMRFLSLIAAQQGGFSLDPTRTVRWTAVDQESGEKRTVTLPRMNVGDTWLGQNADTKTRTPLVDVAAGAVGSWVTVFQRINDDGDMLRVATSVENDGKRAIGTYIPAVGADGKPNPVVSALLDGESYRGSAQVIDAWSITAYDPIKDSRGRVTGAVFTGVPEADVTTALQETLADLTAGEHGNAAIVSTASTDRGRVIASRNPDLIGQPFGRGAAWVDGLLDETAALDEGEHGRLEVTLAGVGDAPADDSVIHSAFYPEQEWAVVVQEYGPDFEVEALANGRAQVAWTLGVLGVLMSLVSAGVAWWIALRISRRVALVNDAVASLAQRDLTVAVPDLGQDEVGQMGRSVNDAVVGLREVLTRITAQAGQVEDAAHRLAAGGEQTNASAEETAELAVRAAGLTTEVNDNVALLSVASEEMTASIREIASSAHEAASVARDGVHLAGDVDRVVATLEESTARIAEMVDVIATIAAQTNLLALNATIEAARAGESGKGFAVVASEVKELARQTAVATQEVTDRVAAIRADTRGASTAVAGIAETIGRVNDYQAAIAAAVEQQTATTNEMARSVSSAARGTGDIAETVDGVESRMQGTKIALEGSVQAVASLAGSVEELGDLVNSFRV
ncbi:methyl-accepting chemotaxis protein [Nocardioides yefusunii]|uniref:Methyl-accepting chemotaxis protein n=1 Tax=Nocardioides yefusunii TaxID=2500546 RepID=A0ABW1R1E3_9ACTN|nr:Cache 3/Cache 2 fusion domain-containing protein [Nocardioides yefusunii]